jgi:hypothetical protein
MSYKYDDDVHINEGRDVVFSWLRDDKTRDYIRVEASREFIEDNWKLSGGTRTRWLRNLKSGEMPIWRGHQRQSIPVVSSKFT